MTEPEIDVPSMLQQVAPPEVQMARVEEFARLKTAVEKTVAKYRDFSREDLTDGQFAVQILLAIFDAP